MQHRQPTQPDSPRADDATRSAFVGIELVVGLGNPGPDYEATRHNVGFRVVDELARRHDAAPWCHRPSTLVTSAYFGPRLILAKPTTFMNRSGRAVAWLLDHLDVTSSNMLAVLDDVDLDLGTLRLRRSGGPGTHNGLRDICDRVGTDFPRLRLGVRGHDGFDDLADYVLSPFGDHEVAAADRLIFRAADAVDTALRDGVMAAMSRHNGPE
jgi:PTH1 family peptidyl-tRNA hydrolase